MKQNNYKYHYKPNISHIIALGSENRIYKEEED